MSDMTETNQRATDAQHKGGLSRRQFIAGIGGLGIGAVLGSGITALLLGISIPLRISAPI